MSVLNPTESRSDLGDFNLNNPASSAVGEQDDQLDKLKRQIEKLKAENKELKLRNSFLEMKNLGLERRNKNLELNNGALWKKVGGIEERTNLKSGSNSSA